MGESRTDWNAFLKATHVVNLAQGMAFRAIKAASWRHSPHATLSKFPTYGSTIITSVDLMRAAAICPFFNRISRTASAVTMDVMCCPPTDSVT